MKRYMLFICFVVVISAAALPVTSWWRVDRAINQLSRDVLTPLDETSLVAIERFVEGHWRFRRPWRTDFDNDAFVLKWAATARQDEYLLHLVVSAYERGDPAFADWPDWVLSGANEQVLGAAGALHETVARTGKPRLEDLDLDAILAGDDIHLIIVCIIAYDPDEVRQREEIFAPLLKRPDIPEPTRKYLTEILGNDGPNSSVGRSRCK